MTNEQIAKRLTPATLDALEAALKAATEGDWFVENGARSREVCSAALLDGKGRIICDTSNADDVMIFEEPDEDSVYYVEGNRVKDLDFCALAHNALPALIAEVRRLREAVRWRPLSEAHEDHGPVILMDIKDPGFQMISHVCAETWPDDIEGMTHFAKLPPLTNEEAEEMLAALPMPPAPEGTDA
jgi:hypothetical protein